MRSPDWFVIARREFLERVRTVWFLVVTILGPVGMVAAIVVPAWLSASTANEGVRAQLVDHTGKVADTLAPALAATGWKVESVPTDTPEATLLGRIKDDAIDGFAVIPADALSGGTVVYSGDNATNQTAMIILSRLVNFSVQQARAADAGLSDEQVAAVLMPVMFEPRHTTGDAASTSGMASFIIGYAVMFILYMAILLYAVNVLRSVVQEKTNRVVEIMVAAAKPRALMLGKIIGVGAVGLLQLAIWATIAFLLMRFRGSVLGIFGIEAGDWNLPPLGAIDVAVILGYFVLGYFFYAALYAAIGAMVNSDQEAQQVQTPVVLLLIIPVACVQLVSNDPRGTIAEVLTQIPFASPVLMPMRYLLGGASTGSLLISLGILAVSTYLAAILAARIYRVGILMYGKRPSIRELFRWMRY
jgi:ABC-2 type transport system permease protein